MLLSVDLYVLLVFFLYFAVHTLAIVAIEQIATVLQLHHDRSKS